MKCEMSVCCDLQKGIGKHHDFALHIKNTLAFIQKIMLPPCCLVQVKTLLPLSFFFLPLNNLYSNV